MVGTSPSNPGGMVSIPGQGAKILHGSQSKNQNMKQKKCCKDLKKKKKRTEDSLPGQLVQSEKPTKKVDVK